MSDDTKTHHGFAAWLPIEALPVDLSSESDSRVRSRRESPSRAGAGGYRRLLIFPLLSILPLGCGSGNKSNVDPPHGCRLKMVPQEKFDPNVTNPFDACATADEKVEALRAKCDDSQLQAILGCSWPTTQAEKDLQKNNNLPETDISVAVDNCSEVSALRSESSIAKSHALEQSGVLCKINMPTEIVPVSP